MKKVGRKRKVNYEAVVKYAKANPTLLQSEIATYFGTTQSRVSQILRQGGLMGVYRGQPPSRRHCQSDEEYEWELILHNAGLGMERGMRIRSQRVLYGYDPAKETCEDESVTNNSSF